MNISVELNLFDVQNTGKNLQNIKRNLDSLDLDHIALGFYAFILDDLCEKLFIKALKARKKTLNFILSPAAAYVLFNLWKLLPTTVYADIQLMRKIIHEIDRGGIRNLNF